MEGASCRIGEGESCRRGNIGRIGRGISCKVGAVEGGVCLGGVWRHVNGEKIHTRGVD